MITIRIINYRNNKSKAASASHIGQFLPVCTLYEYSTYVYCHDGLLRYGTESQRALVQLTLSGLSG